MPEAGFSKKRRLSNAAEFNAVFSKVEYKVASRHLMIFALGNRRDFARLGLVVGRKHAALAVQRNRCKRVMRTSFRQNQQLLAGLDIVILARNEIGTVPSRRLRETIDQLWQELAGKRNRAQARQGAPASLQH